jgi:hypothetical protein
MDTGRFTHCFTACVSNWEPPNQLLTCNASSGWPLQGVHFFLEVGERHRERRSSRVVRVGPHALKIENPAIATLRDRLPSTVAASWAIPAALVALTRSHRDRSGDIGSGSCKGHRLL